MQPNANYTTLFFLVLFFSTLNGGLYLIADKYQLFDKYQMYKRRWMPEYCEFCMFFWMALLEMYLWYFQTMVFDWFSFFLMIPIAITSSVMTRLVLR